MLAAGTHEDGFQCEAGAHSLSNQVLAFEAEQVSGLRSFAVKSRA